MRVVVTGTNAAGNSSATRTQTAVVAAAPPVNTVLPTISGTAQDGQTLTAANGTWTGTAPITYTYQWRRCDAAGASCVEHRRRDASTYSLVAADVGATLRVVVTGTNAAGNSSATSSATGLVAARAPVNTVLPAISGTAEDGQTLTSSHRHLDRHGADHLHLPVAPLRRDRRELRGHRRARRRARTRSAPPTSARRCASVVTATNTAGTASRHLRRRPPSSLRRRR